MKVRRQHLRPAYPRKPTLKRALKQPIKKGVFCIGNLGYRRKTHPLRTAFSAYQPPVPSLLLEDEEDELDEPAALADSFNDTSAVAKSSSGKVFVNPSQM